MRSWKYWTHHLNLTTRITRLGLLIIATHIILSVLKVTRANYFKILFFFSVLARSKLYFSLILWYYIQILIGKLYPCYLCTSIYFIYAEWSTCVALYAQKTSYCIIISPFCCVYISRSVIIFPHTRNEKWIINLNNGTAIKNTRCRMEKKAYIVKIQFVRYIITIWIVIVRLRLIFLILMHIYLWALRRGWLQQTQTIPSAFLSDMIFYRVEIVPIKRYSPVEYADCACSAFGSIYE